MSEGQAYAPQYPGYGPPVYGPPPLPAGVEYASFGRRAAAYLLDVLMIFVCLLPAVVPAAIMGATADPDTNEPQVWAAVLTAAVGLAGILAWLYSYLWRMGSRGQSWGKQWMGIHLVRERDLRPPGGWVGVGRYLLRSLLGNASCGVYAVLTVLWPLWDPRNQTLDDKILSTLVIRVADGAGSRVRGW